MKALSITTAVLAVLFIAVVAANFAVADPKGGSGTQNRGSDCPNFVDEDGDGVNDNCPNGGTRPQDGSGAKYRRSRDGGDRNGRGDLSRDRRRIRNPGDRSSRRNTRSRRS